MLNVKEILKIVSSYTNANNELEEDKFDDIVAELDENEVTEVLAVLKENGIVIVEEVVNEAPALGDYKKLQQLTNEELCVLYQRGDQAALEALCANNKRLVYKIAVKVLYEYAPDTLTEEDLFIEGNYGLITAAEKFQVELGNKFSTYAVWWIRQAITREVMNHGYGMRLPVHVFEQVIKVNKVRKALNGGTPEEIREKLYSDYQIEYSQEKVNELLLYADRYLNTSSLNKVIGDGDSDTELMELVADEKPTVEDRVIAKMNAEIIESVLNSLTERECMVIKMRFGLAGNRPMTLEEVGAVLGVTRERIRQIEAKALRKLRQPARRKILEGIYAA